MAEPRIVTFTSDFGLQDPFVGIMHGVVLNIEPATRIVDISHAVPSFNVLDAAFTIAQSYRFFPPRTVHVAIVDPGVGSERRPILAETDDFIFIAPDNGVLSLVERREARFSVRHITAERYFLQPVSQTFHGRDIFAPVAGWLSKGVAPTEFGPEITDYLRLPLPAVKRSEPNRLCASVLKIDKFGNLITNLTELDLPALFSSAAPGVKLLIAGHAITRVCRSYAEGGDEEFFAIVGSSGYVEIAARQASAAQKLCAGVGEPVSVVFGE
ncbi:MAG TPA: SAM-dependent chlorinase/fluorinase [Candidatus Angelobacter sp.]|nr:SAM-dependent chlorinase/fluorinase [Candidatus Angelobacter sp.]